jgi:hypothetical protein
MVPKLLLSLSLSCALFLFLFLPLSLSLSMYIYNSLSHSLTGGGEGWKIKHFITLFQESSHPAGDRGRRGVLHVPAQHRQHEEASRLHRGLRWALPPKKAIFNITYYLQLFNFGSSALKSGKPSLPLTAGSGNVLETRPTFPQITHLPRENYGVDFMAPRLNVERLNVKRLNVKQLNVDFWNVERLNVDFWNVERLNVDFWNVERLNVDYNWTSNYFEHRTILNVELFVRTLI